MHRILPAKYVIKNLWKTFLFFYIFPKCTVRILLTVANSKVDNCQRPKWKSTLLGEQLRYDNKYNMQVVLKQTTNATL